MPVVSREDVHPASAKQCIKHDMCKGGQARCFGECNDLAEIKDMLYEKHAVNINRKCVVLHRTEVGWESAPYMNGIVSR